MKNKKLISIVSALCLISFIIGGSFVYLVYGQTASTFWITEGVYSGAPTYTVWIEGSYYFSKNAYGEIESGTNATTIIQNCIDYMEVYPANMFERSLYIKGGLYLLDAGLTVEQYYIYVYGDGKRSILRANAVIPYVLRVEDAYAGLIFERLWLDGAGNANKTLDMARSTTSSASILLNQLWISGGLFCDVDVTNREEVSFYQCVLGSEDYHTDYVFYQNTSGGFVRLSDSTVYGGEIASVYFGGLQFRAVLCQFASHIDYGNSIVVYLRDASAIPTTTITNSHFERRNASHICIYGANGAIKPVLYVSDSYINNPIQGYFDRVSIHSTTVAISGSFTYGINLTQVNYMFGDANIYRNISVSSGNSNVYNLYYGEWQTLP